MKRDLELIRKLLIFFDEKVEPDHVPVPPIPGYNDLTIKYHQVLLYDAGYLSCETIKSTTSDRVIDVWPFELTWAGHEFLDKIRTPLVWDEVIAEIKKEGFASASVDVVSGLADSVIRKQFKLE